MDFNDVVFSRRSIRKFIDKDVEEEKVKLLLRYAMASPSAMNKRPLKYIVIQNKDILNKLSMLPFSAIKSNLMIAIVADLKKAINPDMNGFWIQDASASCQNILLGARNLGLGSLWIGTYPVEAKYKLAQEILNLKSDEIPVILIHIGYTDLDFNNKDYFADDLVKYIK